MDQSVWETLAIDDTRSFEPVIVRDLPRPVYDDFDYRAATESLRLALLAADRRDICRSFSLRQVRDYVEVRELAPEINLACITFATNSFAIQPSQAEHLREMGLLMRDFIRDDPTELFLVEGHTDATGPAGYNLLLSDRRAASVALALTEYLSVPPENMVVQGYGQSQLNHRCDVRAWGRSHSVGRTDGLEARHHVKQFACDRFLAALAVKLVQAVAPLVDVALGGLHRGQPRCVLAGQRLDQRAVDHHEQPLLHQPRHQAVGVHPDHRQ